MSLLLFAIATMMCGANDCKLVLLEPGITYPTLAQCQAALDRKATDLLNIAVSDGGPPGDISCVQFRLPAAVMRQTEFRGYRQG